MSPSTCLIRPDAVPADGGAGARLRQARRAAGMTVERLAELAEIDKGHLSRIETGHRPLPEPLAERVAGHLGVTAASILVASGRLTGAVVSALASEGYAAALAPPRLDSVTLPALRRIHLAHLAEEHLVAALGTAADPPRLPRILASAGVSVARGAALGVHQIGRWRFEVGPDVPADHGPLVMAHLAAHHLLGHEGCELAGFGPPELEATAMASFLLAPRPALRSVALRIRNELGIEPWGDTTGLIALAAQRFNLPLWAMARRFSEDGLLAEMVEVPDL